MLAERFGWSLEYIQTLPEIRVREFFAVERGREAAATSIVGKGGKRG